MDGWRDRHETRLRQTWRGLIMERLWESESGERQWRKETGIVKVWSGSKPEEQSL